MESTPQRTLSHRELDQVASLLRATLESTADGILVVDLSGHMVLFNRRFSEIWRLPADLLCRGADAEALAYILPQVADPRAFQAKVHVLYLHPERSSRDEIVFRDGRTVERYSRPQRIGSQVVGRVWSFRDVTARIDALKDRDRLIDEKMRALSQAEEAQRRWALLAEASRQLASSLDDATTLATAAHLAVPELADACAVFSVEGEVVRCVAAAHRDPALEKELFELFTRFPPALHASGGLARVYATGKPVLIQSVDDAFIRSIAHTPEQLHWIRHSGLSSYLAVPLASGGVVRGAMLFGMTGHGRAFGPRDVPLAVELGRRCAVAVENARMFRAMQEAVRRNEESVAMIDALFRTAPIGLCIFSPELRYLRINDVLSSVHGLRPEEAAGRTLEEVIPELASAVRPLLKQVLDTGETVRGTELSERPKNHPDTECHWLLTHFPVRTPDGRMIGVGVTALDETERRNQAEKLSLHLREAQEAIRARDEFLSIASHELKTPLTAAHLRLQLLVRAGPGPTARRETQLLLLGRQLERMAQLVDELLDVSRIRVGRLHLQREPVELVALVREEIAAMDQSLRGSGCEVRLDAPAPVFGTWDRGRLKQILDNLLSNALKFGSGHPVDVGVHQVENRAVLTVHDRGPGIGEADQARIFQRFERAVSSRQYGGLGLGLYVVRQIAEAHGGTATVQSRPGAGATLRVEMPLAPD